MTEQAFAERIRQRYPEGLTGIFAVGGTRMTYILNAAQQNDNNLGHIEDYSLYIDDMLKRVLSLARTFFELGGQNMIIPVMSYQIFSDERGREYADLMARFCLSLIEQRSVAFYRELEADPYFVGIDTLLHFPQQQSTYTLASEYARFNHSWNYQDGRRKIIWEIAPIPLFSFWQAHQVMGQEAQAALESDVAQAENLEALHDLMYRYYARAVYGTDLPMPHFYIGTNRNGDLKLRSMLPIAMLCGGTFRLFFTPYPSFFMTRDTLITIIEDLAFGRRLRSTKIDYRGKLTPELVESESQRIIELSADPNAALGLSRQVVPDNSSE